MRIEPVAENAVIFYTDSQPDDHSIGQLNQLTRLINVQLSSRVTGAVPSYQSLLVSFDPMKTDHEQIRAELETLWLQVQSQRSLLQSGKIVRLPVYYSEQTGPDLQRIAEHHHMKVEEVVTAHCLNIYRVYAIGFAPGFAYLGDVDSSIAMPRLASPRAEVPRGAVGIADRQTAIYPNRSPGGWNIIGNCPSTLFSLTDEPPMPLVVGDRVQFMPISEEEFRYLGGAL